MIQLSCFHSRLARLRSFEGLLARELLHLCSVLFANTRRPLVTTPWAESLVSLLVLLLEMQVSRRSGSPKHSEPVLDEIPLSKGPMSLCLGEPSRRQILSRSLTLPNKHHMIHPQSSRIRKRQKPVYKHSKRDTTFANSRANRNTVLVRICDNMPQAGERKKQSQKRAGADKAEEESIVAPSHTVVDPDTMMVQSLYTVVADSAMITARWSPDVASLAVFDRYIHGSSLRCRQSNHHPVIRGWSDSKGVIIVSRGKRVYIAWKDLDLSVFIRCGRPCELTPGFTNDAWTKDEKQTKNR